MKKNYWIYIIVFAVVAVPVYFFWPKDEARGNYDEFALCLSGKGITMYGAYWCPHCQNEKKAFGDSFRLVNYIECPASSAGGPDGKRFEGEMGLEKLSEASGCLLEDKK